MPEQDGVGQGQTSAAVKRWAGGDAREQSGEGAASSHPDVQDPRGQVHAHLQGREREHVRRWVQGRKELDGEQASRGGAEEARAADHRVVEGAVRGIRVPHARLVRDERLVVKKPE